ncbi:MAG: type II toxin-antitoxin system prevent-host-death family antitoxin [Patescibacteria group bacterium]
MLKNNYQIVGLKKLRENIDEYISAVGRGHRFIVVRKSKPVFMIDSWQDADELWETAIDFTKIKNGGVGINDLLKRL